MNYYNEIKNKLIDNGIYKKVKDYSKNRNDLETYYEIGRLLVEAQGGEKRAKYGDGLIKEYSRRLQKEVGKKYTYTVLTRMRQFYLLFANVAPSAQLSWSHYQELLPLKDKNEINYYLELSINYNLSKRQLREKIKSKEYERLPLTTRNKLVSNTNLEVQDLVKDPIIIKNTSNIEIISEKVLKQLILEDLDNFLLELGNGFTYIANEYKIKVDNNFNYIDILLYNILYNCYVVVELKVTELKKEHIGQIETYMNYIDENIKSKFDFIKISSENKGVWERFRFALQYAKSKYVCIFDDDTIPGCRWLENCMTEMLKQEGLYGTIGIVMEKPADYPKYNSYFRVGWDGQLNYTAEVDFVGHSWFLKKEWLKELFKAPNEIQKYKRAGEDMSLSYQLLKKGIKTFIPPHPKGNEEMFGSIDRKSTRLNSSH